MRRSLRSIWSVIGISRSIRRTSLVVLVCSFFENVLILASPLYMMQVYDRVLVTGRVDTLIYVSLLTLVAFISLGMLDGARSYILSRLGQYIDGALREPVLVEAIATARRGAVGQRRLLQDVGVMRGYFGSTAILPFADAPWSPLFIGIITLIHPWLGLFAAASAVLLFLLALANDLLTRTSLRNATDRSFVANEFASAALANADVVHAMGMRTAVSHRYRRLVDDAGSAGLAAADIASIIGSTSKALRIGVQSAVLGIAAYLVIEAQMTPGGMIASTILLGRALAPIEQSIVGWKQFIGARDAYRTIKAFLSSLPAKRDGVALPNLSGRLSVNDLVYRVPGQDEPVIKRVSFELQPGTALALVGSSASGKTTLCRLLVGSLVPAVGNVRLDGADITSLNTADLARSIGYLPQNVDLFGETVRDTIARLGAVDDAAVVAAARMAGCHEMILKLPNGYDTELAGGGSSLSGGQRQRIGLARALYGNPQLIVLDEPNSNLDQEGEVALVEAIAKVKARGATVVVVSHRLSLMKPIDWIGVLRDGQFEKFGRRDSILLELSPQRQGKPAHVVTTDPPAPPERRPS